MSQDRGRSGGGFPTRGGDRGRGGGDRGGRGDINLVVGRGRPDYRGGGDRGRGGGRGGFARPEMGPGKMWENVPAINTKNIQFEEAVTKTNKDQKAKIGEIALRPSYGTLGKKTNLRVNFFAMEFKPGVTWFCYKVGIKPEPSPRRLLKEIFWKLLQDPRIKTVHGASDSAAEVITVGKITGSLAFKIGLEAGVKKEDKVYDVTLSEGIEIDHKVLNGSLLDLKQEHVPSELIAVRALNILMAGYPAEDPKGVAIIGKGRNKYFWIDERKQNADLSGGLECVRGFYSSVRLAAGRVLLNLNVNHSAFFRPGPLQNLMMEFERNWGNDPQLLNRYIRGVRVELNHLKPDLKNGKFRQRSIWGLAAPRDGHGNPNPPRIKFMGAGPDDIQFYESDREHPAYPSIQLRNTQKPCVNIGNSSKPVYVPMEVASVLPGQVYNGELHTTQRQNIIKHSCRPPSANFASIIDDGLKLMGAYGKETMVRGFKIAPEMCAFPGRILSAPNLRYGNVRETPRGGSWNLMKKKFTEGGKCNSWGCLVLFRKYGLQGDIARAMGSFQAQLKSLGVSVPNPGPTKSVELHDRNWREQVETVMREAKSHFELLVVILTTMDEKTFSWVKFVGDCRVGILNHCMQAEKFMRGDVQYLANNAMKVNLKLGGVCQMLDQASPIMARTMVVGLDVTHPSPTDPESFPSLACIVASVDGRAGQWPGEIRIQERRQESVIDLKPMLQSRLQRWKKGNKDQLPANILVYRDGVSEGQYMMVLEKELREIKSAIEATYKTATQPKVTVIVVTKRHNVRFYPTTKADTDNKMNAHNGSILDRGITRPRQWDFYLQAQSALQGSARPAHYIIIHDEIFTNDPKAVDNVQEITHNICYLMGRCTRSISYATPAFLADKFCDRARKYARAYYSQEADVRGNPQNVPAPSDSVVRLATSMSERMVYI
ncbi:hypothetical protein N7495_003681 [Penicillium taxi]|uniref:uncharacterized protein n=1 Tax=Penicillium taxi TaxID=168475 RepID=UPI002544FEB3|nr:uncharacterized protein N7495_003681 [Penicillium taxi]KAJ5898937.1 hypothetical protein N7495_003681 [Penicillium taxi]